MSILCFHSRLLIYIPLWSYSNGRFKNITTRNIFIYIPLWSYSNGISFLKKSGMPIFTFHYGPIQIKIGNEKCVYAVWIYIPLWSYSNDMLTYATDEYNEFTFHYGPIQISFIWYRYYITKIFTFHYGPIQISTRHKQTSISEIYIPLWSYSNLLYQVSLTSHLQNLHSTMVLFKFIYELYYIFCNSIYIPLWSYSNMLLVSYQKN